MPSPAIRAAGLHELKIDLQKQGSTWIGPLIERPDPGTKRKALRMRARNMHFRGAATEKPRLMNLPAVVPGLCSAHVPDKRALD